MTHRRNEKLAQVLDLLEKVGLVKLGPGISLDVFEVLFHHWPGQPEPGEDYLHLGELLGSHVGLPADHMVE